MVLQLDLDLGLAGIGIADAVAADVALRLEDVEYMLAQL